MPENPRIEELRRRVQADPASIAFAALAEEYRRLGRFDEAIDACVAGLQRHPAYLSARVTLGRALIETGDLDSAREQFETVLQSAPENIAATRGLAQIHERLGHSTEMDPHLAQLMREHVESMPSAPTAVDPPRATGGDVQSPPSLEPVHSEPETFEAAPPPPPPQLPPEPQPREVPDLPVSSIAAVPFIEPETDDHLAQSEFPEPAPPELPARPDLLARPEPASPELSAFPEFPSIPELPSVPEVLTLPSAPELPAAAPAPDLPDISHVPELAPLSELADVPAASIVGAISGLERFLAAIQHARHV